MTFHALPDGGMEYRPMPGSEFRRLRKEWNMDRRQFGELLGYTGEPRNIVITMKRFEYNKREIPPAAERLLMMLVWFKSDHGYLPDLDRGSRRPMAIRRPNPDWDDQPRAAAMPEVLQR
jgi:hypothetical protein